MINRWIQAGLLSALCLVPALSGCDTIGAVGGVVAYAMPHYTDAAYKGLPGQETAIMVWVDRGTRLDNPDLQQSVAAGVQNILINLTLHDTPDSLKGTSFPIRPDTVIRYQEDHPEMEHQPITDVASKFDVHRLIYIEVTDFQTRSEAVELYRGTMKGNLRVLEITNGQAKQAFSEDGIEVVYPKDTPKEGMPIGTDYKIGQGVIDAFCNAVAKRFYKHEEDDH